MKRWLLLPALTCIAAACSSPSEPGPLPEYPNGVGTVWRYAIVDSVTQRRDTAVVEVVRTGLVTTAGGATVSGSIWVSRRAGAIDSLAVWRDGSSVRMDAIGDSRTIFRRIDYPLASGMTWETPGGRDTVRGQALILLPDNESPVELTDITGAWANPDDAGSHRITYLAEVGIYRMSRTDVGGDGVIRTEAWTLLSGPGIG